MNLSRLIDVYALWITSGIFSDLQAYDVPWKDKNISDDLDVLYYGQYSGDKIISPFVEKFLSDDGSLSAESRARIASAIYAMCGENWKKLWATTVQEYELLDNTNAYTDEKTTTEQNTDTKDSGTNTGNVVHAITGKDTTTDTGTVSTIGTTGTDRTVNNDIFGFNSSDPSNADKQTGSDNTKASQTDTRNLSSELAHNTTDTETRNLADSRTGNEKTNGTVTHEVHRHGNIGVTTSQQMLQEERDLWHWYFYEYVFTDIDRFLTISVY